VVKAVEHFRPYLYGRPFTLRTDHESLRWMTNLREPQGQVARWLEKLQEFNFDILHRKGTNHGNADALSRRPCNEHCRSCRRQNTEPSVRGLSQLPDVARRQATEEPVSTLYRAVRDQVPISAEELQEASPKLRGLAQTWELCQLCEDGVLTVRFP
jgi:hypothetical protein